MGGWREEERDEVVLVRVYGEGTERYIDRGAEVRGARWQLAGAGCQVAGDR